MSTAIHKKVAACKAGTNPQLITRMPSGWLILGDVQFLHGYCLLMPDPVVPDLNAMSLKKRNEFLQDMSLVGDALLDVTAAIRINYEILGNLEPALHGHIFPRFSDEDPELKTKPVWFYDWENARAFDADTDQEIMLKIRNHLEQHGLIESQ
ncbi:MAG: hypothetical protein KJO88_06840 [Gammaproteobacteria bacterium]|nr:hypothetical protein [Gammaproteobacteria bacterium]NNM14076.1 hypothetical protein [Gammaproteobacteria bacterium]